MKAAALALAHLLAAAAFAAEPPPLPLPDAAAVESVRRLIDEGLLPELDRIGGSPPRTAPEPPAPPVPHGSGSLDVLAGAGALGPLQGTESRSGIFVLVSFSVPPAALAALARDARRAGAAMVLRGLKDRSLRATVRAVEEVRRAAGPAAWMVDPLLFRALAVEGVPAFAAVAGADSFVVAGDVSLGHALAYIGRNAPAAPAAAADAAAGRLARD